MPRFLITGGTGFIGRRLTAELRSRFGSDAVVSIGSSVDLREWEATRGFFCECGALTHILHLADVSGDGRWTATHSGEQFLSNSRISLNVLRAWREFQPAARMVGFSTLWAYPERLSTATESSYWDGPMPQATEHYGLNKKFLGVGIASFRRQFAMHGTMLVLGSVYGPGDTTWHVIPSLLRRMRENPESLLIWGDGSQTRDFIYIDDQVEGILRHLDTDEALLNIGSGRSHSVAEVVQTLARLLPYNGKINFDPAKDTGVRHRSMDLTRSREISGWPDSHHFVSLEEGLRRTIEASDG